jgi:HSP20 family protein
MPTIERVEPRGWPDRMAGPSEHEDFFELFFSSPGGQNKAIKMEGGLGWRPATDVFETEEEFVVQVDLAGMERTKIEVFVDEDFITFRGTRSQISPAGKKHYHKMEIMVGPFERHVRVPDHVDTRTAVAKYREGFLFVHMKRGQGRQPARAEISVQG